MTVAPSLARFLAPRSIAIIGASPERTKIRGLLLHLLRQNGYGGRLYPVNPSYREIDGVACFPSVAAIGEPIDLALIAIPAPAVLASLEDCAAAAVAHAIVISSGFAEQGGEQATLQAEIAALARRTGLRISGPNAEGFHNEVEGVAATFSPAVERKPGEAAFTATTRRIGIVAQSGGMGFALYNRGRALGLAFSYVITTGNEADLTLSDFFAHLVSDDDTAAIMLFLEGVRDPEKFKAAAQLAAERGKPVVVAKMGRTAAGERAAASHTASMAGWHAAYEALFRKYGIIAATDPDAAVAIAAALTTCPPAKGERVAVVTTSGGAGAWAADALASAGLTLPELGPALQREIREFIPAYGSARNPVDITAQAVHTGGLIRTIELLSRSSEVDIVVVVCSLASETRMTIDLAALRAIVAAQAKPLLFYSYTLPSPMARRALATAGMPIADALAPLVAGVRALTARGAYRRPSVASAAGGDNAAIAAALGGASVLSEHEAREILRLAGLCLPPHRLVREAAELEAAAAALGFPLALKIQSRNIPHKTEIGGVRLGIGGLAALRDAYEAVVASARRQRPDAVLDGVLLQPMAPPGVEVIVGAVRDPLLGPLIMVGAGGVLAELFRDTIYRLAPLDGDDVQEMLERLRIAPLLAGYRGAAPLDGAALAELILRISDFAMAQRELVREVELNPVILHEAGRGYTIVDALIAIDSAR